MSAEFNFPGISLQLLLSTFSFNFSNSFFHRNLSVFITSFDPPQTTNGSVQYMVLLTTISTDIVLMTALINLNSKRQENSSLLRVDKFLLDATFDLALTDLTLILSLNKVLA